MVALVYAVFAAQGAAVLALWRITQAALVGVKVPVLVAQKVRDHVLTLFVNHPAIFGADVRALRRSGALAVLVVWNDGKLVPRVRTIRDARCGAPFAPPVCRRITVGVPILGPHDRRVE